MLWSIGFLVTFLFGGLTGIILASPPLDFHVSDTLLRRGALPLRGVRHRRVRDVRRLLLLVAQVHRAGCSTSGWARSTSGCCSSASTRRSWSSTGSGVEGMPRRYADYLPEDGFTLLNQISTHRRLHPGRLHARRSSRTCGYPRKAPKVQVDDPWGFGGSLEWATSCPPPRHNFTDAAADPLRAARLRPAPPRGGSSEHHLARRLARRPHRRQLAAPRRAGPALTPRLRRRPPGPGTAPGRPDRPGRAR